MRRRKTRRQIAAAANEPCQVCGLIHSKLGIEIRRRTMYRTARASTHMLHDAPMVGGAAWAFNAMLIDLHPEIQRFEIQDVESGRLYAATGKDFRENAIRIDLGRGPQLALKIQFWKISKPEAAPVIEHTERPAQVPLFVVTSGDYVPQNER